jgi:hypothetical protein
MVGGAGLFRIIDINKKEGILWTTHNDEERTTATTSTSADNVNNRILSFDDRRK